MRKWKRFNFMLFVSVLVLSLILTGCNSDAVDEKDNTNNDPSTEGVSGELEIQYFVGGYGDSWWKEVIKDFKEKYPDIKIKEHAGPNINEQMRTRWISDDPPDVVYIDGAGSSETQMVEDGQLMDLTEWVDSIKLPDGTPLADSFIVEPNRYDGKLYSLPLVFDTWGVWYDQAYFEENGFKVPTDFESWITSMKEIKSKEGSAPFTTTGKYLYYFSRGVLNPAFAAEGGDELLSDIVSGKEGVWTSEPVVKVMEKVQRMYDEGLIDPGFSAINHTQSQMNFLLHKNAYIPVGFWLPNEMSKDVPDGFSFGFTPSPMQDKGEPLRIVPDLRPLAIAENAENPVAAKAFVEFVFQEKYASLFSEHTGALMSLKGVDLDSNDKVPGYLKVANSLINDPSKVQINHLPYPMSAEYEKPVTDALLSLMSGKIDAEELCQLAEEAAAAYRNSK